MDNSFAYQPATERYERMLYKYCGRSGLKLPLISLGLWHNFGSVDDFTMATDMISMLSITVLLISIWQTTTVLFPEVPKQTSGGF